MRYDLPDSAGKDFWGQRIRLVLDSMIPLQLRLLEGEVPDAEPSHAIDNFRIAAGLMEGEYYGFVFQDSDLGKWIEAAAYRLKLEPDQWLEQKVDDIVNIISKAQQPDGYLNTWYTIKEPGQRWTNLQECHELYSAGHLIEGAVAYYEATGKRELLDIMSRMADHIDRVFGPEEGKLAGYPGHPEIELALFRLYTATGEKRYLNLAKFFIDVRGTQPMYFEEERKRREGKEHFKGMHGLGPEYAQWHKPVREQDEAVGHAVRALYLYTGAAWVARETGDQELIDACKTLWQDTVRRKMYITGAFGATHIGEAFMSGYELPNDSAYAETCAAIAMLFFSRAMLRVSRDGAIADVMERILYNGMLSGMSLEADRFFYVNPLETVSGLSGEQPGYTHALPRRPKWFGCACCPPNLARLIASLPDYAYDEDTDGIIIHQFIGGKIQTDAFGGVTIEHESLYPWDGALRWTVKANERFALSIRVPGWAGEEASLSVNGEEIGMESVLKDGYARVERDWHGETIVALTLPMKARRQYANPLVRQNAGCAAFTYGPLVYCIEGADNPAPLSMLRVKRDAIPQMQPYDKDLLGGVRAMKVDGVRLSMPEGDLYREVPAREEAITLTAIPYYAFANRDLEDMRVWIPEAL